MTSQAKEVTLAERYAEEDRKFAEWCKQMIDMLPASAGFYRWLLDGVEARIRHDEHQVAA